MAVEKNRKPDTPARVPEATPDKPDDRPILCYTCKHSQSPCSSGACACEATEANGRGIRCRVKMNLLDPDYDFDPYTCKYYFSRNFKLY